MERVKGGMGIAWTGMGKGHLKSVEVEEQGIVYTTATTRINTNWVNVVSLF